MTTWTIRGRSRRTGRTDTHQITAASEQAARQAAQAEGFEVESIAPAGLRANKSSTRPSQTQHGALDAVGSGIAMAGLIIAGLGLLIGVVGLVMGNMMGIVGVSAVPGGLILWIIGAVLSRIDRR
jgi:type II secretory pathway component PulF